jgi:hypothetical protein
VFVVLIEAMSADPRNLAAAHAEMTAPSDTRQFRRLFIRHIAAHQRRRSIWRRIKNFARTAVRALVYGVGFGVHWSTTAPKVCAAKPFHRFELRDFGRREYLASFKV